MKLQKQFSKTVCTPGVDFKYYSLLKGYRGDGLFIPMLNKSIDNATIEKNLQTVIKKANYIDSIVKRLEKIKKINSYNTIKKIEKTIDKLLVKKERGKNSIKLMKQLKDQYKGLLKTNFYLKNFNFPNDHLLNRSRYEKLLDASTDKELKLKNDAFFYRKIIEDGAFDLKKKSSDIYLRSTLETIWLELEKNKTKLSENLRYDILWSLEKIKKLQDKDNLLKRMVQWKQKIDGQINAYKRIIELDRNEQGNLLNKKIFATNKLKKFVYEKQKLTYDFWMKQNELMKKLFVMETILFNEAGTVDGKYALERKNIAKIVMNRFKDPEYNLIDKKQDLYAYIKKYSSDKIMGTLFKKGEFSFTYYYISSVVKIFCPDMTRFGQKVRAKNLKISYKALKNYKYDFKPVRYFSRVSMFGKVDMAKVWTDFKKEPHMIGIKYKNQTKLRTLLRKGKYKFLYSFINKKKLYKVLEINDKIYTVDVRAKGSLFYTYRDPHLFTYFSKK
ncbi:MAG: hypothetical protein N4A33_07245 [Bacteriovoracaceae bacterium]|nr:hypothetical protein [Bacteriovoracaceae bacterium]